MSLRLEPVVLITSTPPGSSQKRKFREEPSNSLSAFVSPKEGPLGNRPDAQRRRTMYVSDHGCPVRFSFYLILTYIRIPSSCVEVLLPPLGSWKHRLLDRAGNRRTPRPVSGP